MVNRVSRGNLMRYALPLLMVLSTLPGLSQGAPAVPPSPGFEVASIHPHQGPLHALMDYSSSGPRLRMGAYTLHQFIMEAYDLKTYQVVWAPGAAPESLIFYDLVAVAPGEKALSRSEFRPLLQRLLADRFALTMHTEMKEQPVYLLVVDKGGPKFKPSATNDAAPAFFGVNGRNQTINMPRDSMDALAQQIPSIFSVGRPVMNRTDLQGSYDIHLEATPEFRLAKDPQPEDVGVFAAIREQLGLRLESSKEAIETHVVDHVERPSEN